jgi:RimJ/RimL family protein N-acetyltransferase
MTIIMDHQATEKEPDADPYGIPILLTERLRLRSFRAGDLDDYAAMYADREVLRYLACGMEPWDLGRCWRHMAFTLGHWPLRHCGMWAVEDRETGAFLGSIGFAEPAGWPGCELAWALARRWWGYGYATEGARAALAYAFTVLGKERVVSLIHPENRASIRVAERIGERLQGRIHHLGREMLCFDIERENWRDSDLVRLVHGGNAATRVSDAPLVILNAASEASNAPSESLNVAFEASRGPNLT